MELPEASHGIICDFQMINVYLSDPTAREQYQRPILLINCQSGHIVSVALQFEPGTQEAGGTPSERAVPDEQ
jgi:hypothetical protein